MKKNDNVFNMYKEITLGLYEAFLDAIKDKSFQERLEDVLNLVMETHIPEAELQWFCKLLYKYDPQVFYAISLLGNKDGK